MIRFTLLFFLIVIGCMKPAKTEVEFGEEYRKSEIADALKMAMGDSSPIEIRENEFSLTDLTRVIRGRAVLDLLESVGMTIVKREETSRQIQLSMVEEKVTYDLSENHTNKKLIREYLDCVNISTLKAEACDSISHSPLITPVPTVAPTPTPTLVVTPTVEPTPTITPVPVSEDIVEKSLELFPAMSQGQSEDMRVSYHQLKVTERQVSPPKLVQNSPNCGAIPNCLINVTEIEFDQVNWPTYNKGEKIHIKITTSKDVPYLSRLLEKCQQGSVPIKQEGKPEKDWPRLLVTFCETVRNFKKGE